MMKYIFTILLFSLSFCLSEGKLDLLLMTVATNQTDGYKRYVRSVEVNGLISEVYGMGSAWMGGNMADSPGGAQKIILLRSALEQYKDREDLVILFTDSYDVIINGDKDHILKTFQTFDAKVVFGAEDFCWPDKTLRGSYPKVSHGYRFLNSGAFLGFAPDVFAIVSNTEVKDMDDDQLYYTKIFLDAELRSKHNIKLDTQAHLIQNLNGAVDDVSLKFEENKTLLENTVYQTKPTIIHGNGPSKTSLNNLGNYLANSWDMTNGCGLCKQNRINMKDKLQSEFPSVLISIIFPAPAPFVEEYLAKIVNLIYPKNRIHIMLYTQVSTHDKVFNEWVEKVKKLGYKSVYFTKSGDKVKEWHGREMAVERCLEVNCDYLFNVDHEVHLNNRDVLTTLISYNRSIIAPMITRIGQWWSTFWGAVSQDGFYARSNDYMEIVNFNRMGIWNVPHITTCYLIHKSILENSETKPNYINKLYDPDIAMSMNFRLRDVFMYVVNLEEYGHLVATDLVHSGGLHNDLWQVEANSLDWELRYLHPKYYTSFDPKEKIQVPCHDVYWLPLFSEKFCNELIETMENHGDWSGGKNDDTRLAGGYENVPTVDIHMNQVDLEPTWLYILKTYVKPLAERFYIGYASDAKATMNFVVRYKPTEQPFLRPHHDSSTYTINIGLNTRGVDYEGGGVHFVRHNCSVLDTKVGWALMHPGRLTHFHEGLNTTKGTRYIMISFIDP